VCVFCGSAPGTRPELAEAARLVGTEIGRRGWTLIYGGGRVGLMGIVGSNPLRRLADRPIHRNAIWHTVRVRQARRPGIGRCSHPGGGRR